MRAIRASQKLTQAAFAARYGFPIGTLLDLEQGRARPDASTRAYLVVISQESAAVRRALEATGIEPLRHGRQGVQPKEPPA
ncbi:helix-turn-helix domain-containing protein [Methylobacterium sp. Leaf469]|uniref:helix-turn-helix domain-containing protein n=1 Tax=Methylobacterium sp. Leaf469 TaxID=1736387 RepID=UPI000B1F5F0E|nr:helix-turn-helix domain-containing protein [Methylobacterium sp. Leaf469]